MPEDDVIDVSDLLLDTEFYTQNKELITSLNNYFKDGKITKTIGEDEEVHHYFPLVCGFATQWPQMVLLVLLILLKNSTTVFHPARKLSIPLCGNL